jgi:hypothetical protein
VVFPRRFHKDSKAQKHSPSKRQGSVGWTHYKHVFICCDYGI